ncbi:hypothetical protein GGI07_001575 [Coemansia sp. Benny D115]|nr:hypothetical protein GGI07_001575 [Coemansia sp. Benny D115]
MEYFEKTVKAQTIKLHSLDMLAGFTNIPYIYYFENTSNDRDFMSADLLRDSFYHALLDFPILAGNLCVGSDHTAHIVVDPNDLNMPEYIESSSNIHFDFLKQASFAWSALPKDVVTVGTIPTAGKHKRLKLANAHVTRLGDNSGVVLFFSTPHYAIDGVGYSMFINHWASICRSTKNNHATAGAPNKGFLFDRSLINQCLPKDREPVDKPTLDVYMQESYLAKFLAWVSPETRGSILTKATKIEAIEGHVFRIPKLSLRRLHAAVEMWLPEKTRISDNDVLSGLLSMVVSQGVSSAKTYAANPNSPMYENIKNLASHMASKLIKQSPDMWMTQIVLDIRSRIKSLRTLDYTGNAVISATVVAPLDLMQSKITPKALAQAAMHVRHAVSQVTVGHIGQLMDLMPSEPDCYTRALANTSAFDEKLVISNQSKFPLYSVDFGFGTPSWISPIPAFYPNFASMLPRPEAATDYYVYITSTKKAMQGILKNEFWLDCADLVY